MKKNRFICLALLFIVIGSVSGQKITFEDYLGHFRELKDTLVITDKTQEAIFLERYDVKNRVPSAYVNLFICGRFDMVCDGTYFYGVKKTINDFIVVLVNAMHAEYKSHILQMIVYSKDGKQISKEWVAYFDPHKHARLIVDPSFCLQRIQVNLPFDWDGIKDCRIDYINYSLKANGEIAVKLTQMTRGRLLKKEQTGEYSFVPCTTLNCEPFIIFDDFLKHFLEIQSPVSSAKDGFTVLINPTIKKTPIPQEAIWRYIGEEDNLPPSSYDAGWMIYHYGLKAEINDHIVLFVMQENEYTKVGYILMLVYSKDGKLVSRCEIGKGGEPTLDTGSSTCDFDISLYPFCVNSIQAVNDKAESKANIVYTTYTIDKQGSIKSQVTNKKTGKIDYDDKLGKFIITSN